MTALPAFTHRSEGAIGKAGCDSSLSEQRPAENTQNGTNSTRYSPLFYLVDYNIRLTGTLLVSV